jgi:membrane protease YdiL (CAAX protease family)
MGAIMKHTVTSWAREYPLLAFFGLAILLCYLTMFPAIYLIPRNGTLGQIAGYYFGQLGAFSPVIAGIAVTRVFRAQRKTTSWAHRTRVFLPVWLVAVVVNVANLRTTAPPTAPLIGLLILSVPVALLPAWVISSAANGAPLVQHMLKSFVKPRGKSIYYLIALFTFPAIHIVGSVATNAIEGRAWFPQTNWNPGLVTTIAITFFAVFFFSGGLNEESGWRGFAQQHLQAKHSPLTAALILWFLMVIWHVPNDLLQYQQGGYFAVRWGLYPFITILFTWIFNRTGGSILAVALFHSSMNTMNPLMNVFPNTTIGNVLLVTLAATVVIHDRMWNRLPPSDPAVQHDIETSSMNESAA